MGFFKLKRGGELPSEILPFLSSVTEYEVGTRAAVEKYLFFCGMSARNIPEFSVARVRVSSTYSRLWEAAGAPCRSREGKGRRAAEGFQSFPHSPVNIDEDRRESSYVASKSLHLFS